MQEIVANTVDDLEFLKLTLTIEIDNIKRNIKNKKYIGREYSNEFLEDFISKSKEHLYIDGIISRPYVDENKLKDILILVPKTKMEIAN